MTNVSVDGPIKVFRNKEAAPEPTPEIRCPEYLLSREMAERAAAKHSRSVAARRVHQELASLYSARRTSRNGK